MCGIAGIFSKSRIDGTLIENMTDRIKHRGPDNQGYLGLNSDNIWLGHARLSILDLSAGGNQPMSYMDGRLYLTYNGEVYNYVELENELRAEGFSFRTETDSEVILAAYAHWGSHCVEHFNGMFSFIIVDTVQRCYFAARDRYGIKPLYYWKSGEQDILALASEIKQFTVLPGWKPRVNGQRAYDYLQYGLMDHTNETFFKGVYQVRGGECIQGSIDDPIGSYKVSRWYMPPLKKIKISEAEAVDQFRELFFDSVRLRLRSDVAVGSCLSGGLDSSSIVCAVNDLLKEKNAADSQRTVSALAKGTPHDESRYIDIVLNERGIDGYPVAPAPEDLWRIRNKLIWHQDEPFGSTSIYAQWCVFRKARQENLTVMLDGQGADELLAGYMRFFSPYYSHLFKSLRWKKLADEVKFAKGCHNYSWKTVVKDLLKANLPAGILYKGVETASDRGGIHWYSMNKLGAEPAMPAYYGNDRAKTVSEMSEHLLFYNHLPMLLRYEDRNSMAHSVESRLPFLDYRLAEFIQSLPDDYKICEGQTKSVLRKSMKGVLPEQIRMRMDKIGFETPEEKWEREHSSEFRGMIKDSIEKTNGIINESALDYFDKVVAGNKLDFTVWRMINFGVWYDMFINRNDELAAG